MKKKIFVVVVLLSGFFMIWLIFQSVHEFHQKQIISKRIQHLPSFHLIDLQGKKIIFASSLNKPVVLIYFKTSCPFCQAEIGDIQKHPDVTKYADFFLISRESSDAVAQFYHDNHLNKVPDLDILLDSDHQFQQLMGINVFPNTFVYDVHGHLIKHFRGETKTSAIKGVLIRRTTKAK